MKLAKITGSLSSARKDKSLNGLAMRVVRYLDAELHETTKSAVCIDALGARTGDVVLLCSSSSARQTAATKNACVDNTIVAIVETVSSGKHDLYTQLNGRTT